MDKLINALGKNIRRTGPNKWMARCPVHNDKDFAMSIEEKDGKVLAYCHACSANGFKLYEHLGLPLEELMGEESEKPVIPRAIIEKAKEDRWFIAIYESDVKRGVKPRLAEKRRYRQAKERVKILNKPKV